MAEAMAQLGGVGRTAAISELSSPYLVRIAIRDGHLVQVARGRYRLAEADRALIRAAELRGQASHLSAAQLHGWEVAHLTATPWVTVPRSRVVPQPRRAHIVWAALDGDGFVTGKRRTVVDCARRLPLPDGLSVADSALRAGDITADELTAAAAAVRGKGAAQARLVARHASPLSANPFESCLRGIAITAGLDVQPQVEIDLGAFTVHPDVVDTGRRLALEADSWEHHTSKEAFQRDCLRYTSLVLAGWTVLRFTWWQVMEDSAWVERCLGTWAGDHPARSAA